MIGMFVIEVGHSTVYTRAGLIIMGGHSGIQPRVARKLVGLWLAADGGYIFVCVWAMKLRFCI